MISHGDLDSLRKKLFSILKPKEHLTLGVAGEASQFIRLNGAKIRQIGSVNDISLALTLIYESAPGTLHKAVRAVTLTGISYVDQDELTRALAHLQSEVRELPADPYAQLPKNNGQSTIEKRGRLPSLEEAPEELLKPVGTLDLTGIYAAGLSLRAVADSAGTFHWFSTETFSFDYSIYTPNQRAVKGKYAGQNWNPEPFSLQIESARKKLDLLARPARRIERGDYRAYLEAPAFADLIHMLSWGAVSEASIRQGDSPLQKLRAEKTGFSPLFTLAEDFRGGESPRFNSEGELAPERTALFEKGEFKNTLVNARTFKEYGVPSNMASMEETLRAPSVDAGDLNEQEILKRLGTGLYLSNLHYLNWSHQTGGRITGMTRFACFWVENGEMVSPIENMRFDDTIFRFFGGSLEALTEERSYLPSTGTYGMRSLGGIWTPGALLSSMKFTL